MNCQRKKLPVAVSFVRVTLVFYSDEEDESDKETSPKKTKKVIKKRKTSSHNDVDQDKPIKSFEKPKKSIQKDSPQKYLVKGDDFKRLQKKAKNLAPLLLIILKEKIINTWLNTTTKRFTSVLPTLKIT